MEGKNCPSFYYRHLTTFRLFSYRGEEAKNPSVAFAQSNTGTRNFTDTRKGNFYFLFLHYFGVVRRGGPYG